MNSHMNYLAVKAQMDDRIRAAERVRVAGADDPERSAGARRSSIARVLARRRPRWRLGVPVEPRPCIEERANR